MKLMEHLIAWSVMTAIACLIPGLILGNVPLLWCAFGTSGFALVLFTTAVAVEYVQRGRTR